MDDGRCTMTSPVRVLGRRGDAMAGRDFRWIWTAELVSQTGSQVSALALPLVAIVAFGAGPAAVGLLAAAATAPVLVAGLPTGAWIDGHRRRPVLLVCDLGRAAAVASVPVAWALGALTLHQLYAVAFACGVLTVCADVAAQSFLPSVVPVERLAGANANLEVARSSAQVAGPGLSGGLIGLVGAPLALVVDAMSFGCSAACIARTKAPETRPERAGRGTGIADGLRYVAGHPVLRPIAACSAVSNLGSSMVGTVLVLYMVDSLGLGAGMIGLVLALGNVGLVVGAVMATRLAVRYGVGRVIVGSLGLGTPFALLVPIAPRSLAVPALVAALVAAGVRAPIYNVNQISLRQAITPPELLGRMTATMRVLVLGTMPLGSLLAGLVASQFGVRAALMAGALIGCSACLFTLLSPVRSVRDITEHESALGREVEHHPLGGRLDDDGAVLVGSDGGVKFVVGP
jgi:MFS family permease